MRSRSIPNTKLCHLSSDEGTPVIGKGLGDWGTDEPGHVLYGTGGLGDLETGGLGD